LNAAIETTSQKLSESIGITSSAIDRLSENSQSQAATMEELSATIEEISAGTENAAHATGDQNESLGKLIRGFNEMSEFIDRLEKNGTEIAKIFDSIMKLARTGEESSSRLDAINSTILQNSIEILSVVTVMGEFFDKINLLSLNATIEAARAGEQGRGFAVVAEEIGKLSDNSAGELKQISDLMGRNRSDVESGSAIIDNIIVFIRTLLGNIDELQTKAADVLGIIKDQDSLKESMNMMVDTVRQKSELIDTSMQEQKTSIEDVVKSISETNRSVQENTEATENLRHSAEELKELTGHLHGEFEKAR
jgi:methyl-accepting chemotaxis protein